MQIPLEIRTAHISDALAISELVHRVAHGCLGADAAAFVNTISPSKVESHIQNPHYLYVLGFVGNELAGVAAMRDLKHFYHLFVAPEFQYKGIAKSLWHYLKAQAVLTGNGIFTVNSSLYAVAVYEKFGFSPTSEPQSKNGISFVPMQLSVLG
jgi:GNAT superfamily N-acetyltransferase